MKSKGFSFLLILFLLTSLFLQGCSDTNINKEELSTVNSYIEQLGYKEKIGIDSAVAMSQSINQNKNTQVKKSDWEFVVDFVENQLSDNPIELDYDVQFYDGSFSIDASSDWESLAK